MNNKFLVFIKSIGDKLLIGAKRFPESIFLAAVFVFLMIYMNHYGQTLSKEMQDLFRRVIMTVALGVPLFLCIRVLRERKQLFKKWIVAIFYLVATALLILNYLFLLNNFKMVEISRYIAFSLVLYLAFVIIPYFYRRPEFELYVVHLFTRFFITYLYSAVLFAGLSAIIFSIDKLFNANISEKVYLDILLIVAGIFAPSFFLSEIREAKEEHALSEYSKILKVLLLYIVMPMMAAYTVILYAYFVKIIVTWNLPSGIISNLVLWFSIISTIVIFFVYPFMETNKWVNTFIAFFPKLLIPLLAMMFVSMGVRIKAYGITESRYFVLLAGIWVLGCMVYLIFAKRPRNIVFTISLAVLALLSVMGPWSSYEISKASQNTRFERILVNNDMLQNGMIVKAPKDISEADQRQINSIITYFNRSHQLSDLRVLPQNFKTEDISETFGFDYKGYEDNLGSIQYFSHYIDVNNQDMLFEIKDFDYFTDFTMYKMGDSVRLAQDLKITFSESDKMIVIQKQGVEIYSKKVSDIASMIHMRNLGKEALKAEEMKFLDQSSKCDVLYLFKNINGSVGQDLGNVSINMPEFYVFVKMK